MTTATYLVSHGSAKALSSCRDAAALRPDRDEAVVIRSARGLELGTVLCESPQEPAERFSRGDMLRRATVDDQRLAAERRRLGQHLLDDALRYVSEQQLPLLPLDADLTLDGAEAVVYVLRWQPCTLTPMLEELRRRHGLTVFLLDRSRPAEEEDEHGCGSCGSEGGGCGSGGCGEGGCSSGSCCSDEAHTAGEMTAYFAELRLQMEARQRVPLL